MSLDTELPIWSGSKWLTAATIMKLVESGVMSLDDSPSRYLSWWTTDPADSRAYITLHDLLSQTSGLENGTRVDGSDASDACCGDPLFSLESCAQQVYEHNHPPAHEPSTSFAYGRNHWQIIGAMAVRAANKSTWHEVFKEVTADPLALPSRNGTLNTWIPTENPRLGGGFVSNGHSYAIFLDAYYRNTFVSSSSTDMMEIDQTIGKLQTVNPLMNWGYESHYGLGNWIECPRESVECVPNLVHSSLGSHGFYPWIDREADYYALLVVDGRAKTSFALGLQLQPEIVKALRS